MSKSVVEGVMLMCEIMWLGGSIESGTTHSSGIHRNVSILTPSAIPALIMVSTMFMIITRSVRMFVDSPIIISRSCLIPTNEITFKTSAGKMSKKLFN